MKSNFEFLNRYWPALAQIGAAAESYVYSDANACLYKLGMFGERLILEIFAFEHIKEPTIDNTHANRIRLLKREGLIPKKIDDILYALRKTRNDAVHAGADSVEDAKTLLSMTYNLAVWFMEVYGDWGYIAPAFVMPENVVQPDYESIIKEQEEKIVALSKQVDAVSTAASSKTSKERAEKGETASESMDLSEAETRYLIDEQFRKFGWEADTNNLRYSRGTRPQKGRNLAIAEWPTDSTVGKNGYADYALFVGLKLVGIVEAKKAAIDIPSVIDHQCKEYAKGIKAEHKDYVIGQWGAYKVPFVFATNGRKYLKQIETKSGIWCLDLRSGANAPKALQGWISPQGLMEQLEKDIAAANAALQNTPFDLLRDPDGLNLRKYQISAIEAAEQAVIDGKQTVLLSMATGTGKTRTILGMIYRFIKSDRFKRVLFLVDRTALGEQAEDVFKEVKIEELMTLDSIYNIKGLDEKEIDRETKIHMLGTKLQGKYGHLGFKYKKSDKTLTRHSKNFTYMIAFSSFGGNTKDSISIEVCYIINTRPYDPYGYAKPDINTQPLFYSLRDNEIYLDIGNEEKINNTFEIVCQWMDKILIPKMNELCATE